MNTSLLLLTHNSEFGDLVCRALNDTKRYTSSYFSDLQSAIAFLERNPDCAFAMLDSTLGDQATRDHIRLLRAIKWDLKVILIVNSSGGSGFDDIRPFRLLKKPFSHQDMLAILEGEWSTVIELEPAPSSIDARLTWLEDPGMASEILGNLIRKSEIKEAILLRNRHILASTGRFRSKAVDEMNNIIYGSVNVEKNYDLLRYVWVETNRQNYGLYAKFLVFNAILALIFDVHTPASKMRGQANLLADTLELPLLSGRPQTGFLLPDWGENTWTGPVRDKSRLHRLLQERYPGFITDWRTAHRPRLQKPGFGFKISVNGIPDNWFYYGEDQVPRIYEEKPAGNIPSYKATKYNQGITDGHSVAYSCLLTPRFDSHQINNELANLLYSKFPQICTAYGWRLSSFEIDLDCIQWIIELPPELAPWDHIQIIRKITSESIGEEFSNYLADNFSGDFWAPGFAITGGRDRYSREQMELFVRENRNPGFVDGSDKLFTRMN